MYCRTCISTTFSRTLFELHSHKNHLQYQKSHTVTLLFCSLPPNSSAQCLHHSGLMQAHTHTHNPLCTNHLVKFNGHFCKPLGVNPIPKKPLERASTVHLICIQTGPAERDPHLRCLFGILSYSSLFSPALKVSLTGCQCRPTKAAEEFGMPVHWILMPTVIGLGKRFGMKDSWTWGVKRGRNRSKIEPVQWILKKEAFRGGEIGWPILYS